MWCLSFHCYLSGFPGLTDYKNLPFCSLLVPSRHVHITWLLFHLSSVLPCLSASGRSGRDQKEAQVRSWKSQWGTWPVYLPKEVEPCVPTTGGGNWGIVSILHKGNFLWGILEDIGDKGRGVSSCPQGTLGILGVSEWLLFLKVISGNDTGKERGWSFNVHHTLIPCNQGFCWELGGLELLTSSMCIPYSPNQSARIHRLSIGRILKLGNWESDTEEWKKLKFERDKYWGERDINVHNYNTGTKK